MEEIQSIGIGPLQVNENDLTPATELFTDCKDDLSMLDGRFIAYEPNHKDSDTEYEFSIPPLGMTYLQLAQSRLYVRMQIVQENGANIEATDVGKVAFVNMPVAAMFSRTDISLDGAPLADLSNSYVNYKGYLETMMSYSESTAEGHLSASGLIMDTATFFNNFTGEDDTNLGFIERATLTGQSSQFEFMSPLHSDFFQIGKFFPPGVKITVRLTRAPDNFVICSQVANKRFKLKIHDILLFLRHVTMNDTLLSHHQKQLAGNVKLIIPYTKTELKAFSFTPTNLFHLSNVCTDTMPRSIIFGFVKSANFYGSFARNPWYFENLSIDKLFITVAGAMVPCRPYTPNFAANLYMREYREFNDNIGLSIGNAATMITPLLYKDGLCLWAFDLTPDMCNGFHPHSRRTGNIGIEVHFQNVAAEAVTMLAMAIYPAKLVLEKKKFSSSIT